MSKTVLIIGAGPAGLTSGLLLAQQGYKVQLFEADCEYVGGLSKTVKHNGFLFDIGGHRFYTKEKDVQDFWQKILGPEILIRQRVSRIYYKKKFLSYPLQPFDLLGKIHPYESFLFTLSYLKTLLTPQRKVLHFEDWITSRFGKKLFQTFFKSYTEKVWGRDCREISADWAAQRINNLNFLKILKKFIQQILGIKSNDVKSLIEEFEYPKKGPGQLWELVAEKTQDAGGVIQMGARVKSCQFNEVDQRWQIEIEGSAEIITGDHLISSAPLGLFLKTLRPQLKTKTLTELSEFKYRGFITLALMFKGKNSFPDNWIYIHDERVKVARIQNYGNWSEFMVPSAEHVCYGLEYFCQENDVFWNLPDSEIFELAKKELHLLDIPFDSTELDYKVIRSGKAYPVYDLNYGKRLETIKKELEPFSTLHLIGRSGLHRYNNQDHSIKTAMITVENILADRKIFSPWQVNQDAEYIEEIKISESI